MYPVELEMKDTTEINTSASYLDLLLSIGRDGQLHTSIFDKRDDFNFYITNFLFLSSNISTSPAYGVFISQHLRYARACSSYGCFILRATRLLNKLFEQGYAKERLTSSLRKFDGRYGDLIKQYEVTLSRMLNDILYLDHVQWQSPTYQTLYRTRPFIEFWEVFIEHLRRVWHADRGCLLLRTPGPPLWDLHMFYLLRPTLFPNLSLFFWTMLPKYFLNFAFKRHMQIVDVKRRNPIDLGSKVKVIFVTVWETLWTPYRLHFLLGHIQNFTSKFLIIRGVTLLIWIRGQISSSTSVFCLWNLVGTIQAKHFTKKFPTSQASCWWWEEELLLWVKGQGQLCRKPLMGTIQAEDFAQSLSNFTSKLLMMRVGTLSILGQGSKVKVNFAGNPLWARYRLMTLPSHLQTSQASCWGWEEISIYFGSKVNRHSACETLWVRYRLVFATPLSNFTCQLLTMRGETLLILGQRIKVQG